MKSQLSTKENPLSVTLFQQDYYLWLTETIQKLHQGKLDAVDLTNLIEELVDMGRSEKKAIRSNLRILLMHLLKYKYQPEKRTNSWRFTIREHRNRLQDSFQESPSLKKYCAEVFLECYQDSRELASDETGLPPETFPVKSPFTHEDTLNSNFLP